MSQGHEANRRGYTHHARKAFLAAAETYRSAGDAQRAAAARISAANMALKLGWTKKAGDEYRALMQSELNSSQRRLVAGKMADLDIEAPAVVGGLSA